MSVGEYLTYGMQNAIGVGLSVSGFRSTFAPSYELVAKMLMLGSQQASLHCPRLTASLSPKFKPTI
jgi:hypothetical protein